MLSSHRCLGLPSSLFHPGFPTSSCRSVSASFNGITRVDAGGGGKVSKKLKICLLQVSTELSHSSYTTSTSSACFASKKFPDFIRIKASVGP